MKILPILLAIRAKAANELKKTYFNDYSDKRELLCVMQKETVNKLAQMLYLDMISRALYDYVCYCSNYIPNCFNVNGKHYSRIRPVAGRDIEVSADYENWDKLNDDDKVRLFEVLNETGLMENLKILNLSTKLMLQTAVPLRRSRYSQQALIICSPRSPLRWPVI